MLHAAVVLALALAVQDTPPDVAKQAARISAKDPRASLDAVARLSDLSATSRAAVETAAARLPDEAAFYRQVLQEELRVRERLGAQYPKLRRASVDAKDQSPHAVLNEICSKYGEKLDLSSYNRPGAPPGGAASITLKLDDAPFAEALESVTRQAKASFYWNGARLMLNPFQETVGICSYRNFLVFVSFATRSRRIEFGAGETRSLRYTASLFWDSEASVARVLKVRVAEAVDGNGKAVAPAPEEPAPPEPPRKEGDPVSNLYNRFNQWEIALAIPEAEKIARLRGFYEIAVPGAVSAFEFTDLEKDQKKSDEAFEVEVARKTEGEGPRVFLRVKPKGSIDDFIKSPVELLGTMGDGAETPLYVAGRVSEGRVEYPLSQPFRQFGQQQAVKSVRFHVSRSLVERRVPFEFIDLPAK